MNDLKILLLLLYFAPSVTLVANDKGDNEMIQGAVHRS